MRILIAGYDSNAYSLARTFSKDKNVDVVFVAPGNKYIAEFAECIDISDTDNAELLDFADANEISLTVVTSVSSFENDIAGYFGNFGKNIFAPSYNAAFSTLYKSACKKLLYKLKVPTVKFGIFDREIQAINYVSEQRIPLLISNDFDSNLGNKALVQSFSKAKELIEELFIRPENRIVIEDYVDADAVSLYFITDGYSALPIGSCSCDKNTSNSVFSPDNVLTDNLVNKISDDVVYPYISCCSANNNNYCGIIGVDILVCGDEYKVTDLNPFFKKLHLQSILPLIKTSTAELMLSASIGSFSDDFGHINMSNKCVCTKTTEGTISKSKLDESDDENFYYSYTNSGKLILSQSALTYNSAKNKLKSNEDYLYSIQNSENRGDL